MDKQGFEELMRSSGEMLNKTINEINNIKERTPKRNVADISELTTLLDETNEQLKKSGAKPIEQPSSTDSSDGLPRRELPEKDREQIELVKKFESVTPKVNTGPTVLAQKSQRPNRKYDVVPLPSGGQCYPHKKAKIPVYYLTAREENLITSINLYSEGLLIETILNSVIADETIKVDELVQGDIDAILLFLRATAYGTQYPLVITNPYNGNEFEATIDLSDIKYNKLKLVGDENGWFDYETGDGDKLKWGFPDHGEDKLFRKMIMDSSKTIVTERLKRIVIDLESLTKQNLPMLEDNELTSRDTAINCIKLINKAITSETQETYLHNVLTANMARCIKTVNGNMDRLFVMEYIENMRAGEARKFRKYFDEQIFGLNTIIEVKIPEGQANAGETIKVNLEINEDFLMTVVD